MPLSNDDPLVDAATLTTPRLWLRPYTCEIAQALLDGDRTGQPWSPGFPRDDDIDIARMVLAAAPEDREQLAFGPHGMIERETGLVVGALGFFGPPSDEGMLMLGYGVAAEVEGRGLATEAVIALIEAGFTDPRVIRIIGEAEPTNIGSHRVMEKAGMARVEPDGDLIRYAITRAR